MGAQDSGERYNVDLFHRNATGDPLRVLVVEDDPSTARTLVRMLSRLGFAVDHAPDAVSAWRLLQTERFPIVLTDWMMPGRSGVWLCNRLRSRSYRHYVYVVFLTSRVQSGDLLTALRAGADDYLTKPLNPDELLVRMQVAARTVRLQEELSAAIEELQRANARLEEQSRIDPLMGIGNRRAFNERIAEIDAWAHRAGAPYSVVMCDIDHFKCYNDTFGHQAGDQILKRIGEEVRLGLREHDAAFRYGGEEIAVLLRGEPSDGAARAAELIRRRVEAMEFQLADAEAPFRVTISCGVGGRGADAVENWRDIVERADQALYAAKKSGRNRVVVHRGDYSEVVHQGERAAFVEDAAPRVVESPPATVWVRDISVEPQAARERDSQ